MKYCPKCFATDGDIQGCINKGSTPPLPCPPTEKVDPERVALIRQSPEKNVLAIPVAILARKVLGGGEGDNAQAKLLLPAAKATTPPKITG